MIRVLVGIIFVVMEELINSEWFSSFSRRLLMKTPHMHHVAGLWEGDLIGQVTLFYIAHSQSSLGVAALRHASVVRYHSKSAPWIQRSALVGKQRILLFPVRLSSILTWSLAFMTGVLRVLAEIPA
jgi:hypothetical protein